MSFFGNALHHPRRLWLRRALFQVHLWAGVLLSVYVAVIALSGAVLVFEDELTATTLPAGLHGFDPARTAGVVEVTQRFRQEFPEATLTSVTVPTATVPAYQMQAADARGLVFRVVGDPQTGQPVRVARSWVEWVHDLHLYLLLPSTYGAQVNGVGAAALMLLTVTGLLLWWPGVRLWMRGLRVDLRRGWRRINYDLHSAIGFWTLGLVFWWALSGFYFGFYRQVAWAVNAVATVRNMAGPKPLAASGSAARLPLEDVLKAAQAASPQGRLYTITDPLLRGASVYAYMDLRKPGDFAHRDIVQIGTADGRVLSLWHYGERLSLGDWILWSMHPLHFGTLWGLPVKVVWAAAGVGLALLSVTGLVMYWNRYLRQRWAALSAGSIR